MDGFKFIGDYCIGGTVLGWGNNTVVKLATHVKTGREVAVKIMDVTNTQIRLRALQEMEIMKLVGKKHYFITELLTAFEGSNHIYLFLELCRDGNLYSYIKKSGPLKEETAKDLFKQMISAVSYCHSVGIVHHDIKLENILLTYKYSTIRLTDFGLAQRIKSEKIAAFLGSPLYMAPEIFSKLPHDEKVDIWSLGICLYFMVQEVFPFVAQSYPELEERVLFQNLYFKISLSEDIQNLLRKMLEKSASKRLSINNIKQHPWLNSSFLHTNEMKVWKKKKKNFFSLSSMMGPQPGFFPQGTHSPTSLSPSSSNSNLTSSSEGSNSSGGGSRKSTEKSSKDKGNPE